MPPSIRCLKPPHNQQDSVEVKKIAAQQSQINLGKENCIALQGIASCLPIYIISRSIWDHYPISSWNSKTPILNVPADCQETGSLWPFSLWDIVWCRTKGNKQAYLLNQAVLGLSSALIVWIEDKSSVDILHIPFSVAVVAVSYAWVKVANLVLIVLSPPPLMMILPHHQIHHQYLYHHLPHYLLHLKTIKWRPHLFLIQLMSELRKFYRCIKITKKTTPKNCASIFRASRANENQLSNIFL